MVISMNEAEYACPLCEMKGAPQIPSLAEYAEILTEGPVWSKVRIGSRVGWMMTRFMAEELTSMNNEELKMNNDTEEELIDLLTEVYEALRELCERIEDVIAKG